MKNINEQELDQIKGGQIENVTGPIISAFVNIVKVIQEAGYSLGSGIRRMVENEYCPLK